MTTNYQDWETLLPEHLQLDPLWKMKAYRLSLFLSDIGWHDVTKLNQDMRTRSLSDQLYRALGSIGANIAEGYSRQSNKDQARFYEYALGSARESRHWYLNAKHLLGEQVVEHRLNLLAQIIRLLLTMIPRKRKQTIQETYPEYHLQNDIPF